MAAAYLEFVMAKMHQRIDDLIDALLWMRRQESSPFGVAAKNNTQVDKDAITRLAISVVKRLDQSVILRREIGHIGRHVYGFIYIDLRPHTQYIRLMAHSAVETDDGTLCDITPPEAAIDYPFIRHLGTDDEFQLFGGVGHFDLPV